MNIILKILLNGLAVFIASYILPGVFIRGYMDAIVVAVVLALVNGFLKPVLVILTLPITLLTLGIFYIIINISMILLVDWLVPGFVVNGIFWAFLFSLLLSLINYTFSSFYEQERPKS